MEEFFTILRAIGEGAFGVVKEANYTRTKCAARELTLTTKGVHKYTRERFALKYIKRSALEQSSQEKTWLKREVRFTL